MPESRWIKHLDTFILTLQQSRKVVPLDNVKYCSSALNYSNYIDLLLTKYREKLIKKTYRSAHIPQKPTVFANNYLNLSDVKVVGFDLDYTLIPYTVELQHLIYTMARDMLVDSYGFPKELKACSFDPNFAIRGLAVDVRHGVLLKLNHLLRIGKRYAYKGKRQITKDEMESYYGESRHIPHNELEFMKPLNDMFTIAEACLIADAIEIFEFRKNKNNEMYSPTALIDDVKAAITEVHLSGDMHQSVLDDLGRFVKFSPLLPDLIQHFKKANKQMFLCTNSGYSYTNKALSYALGGKVDWRELFDVTICHASKPDFFFSKKPFRLWNQDDDRPSAVPVGPLQPGQAYVHGSVQALERATGWKGKDVLFIGDNLRADLLEARRRHGWHTACVINELDHEMHIQSMPLFNELHFIRSTLRTLINDLQVEIHNETTRQSRQTIGEMSLVHDINSDFLMLKELESQLQAVNVELSSLFNRQFGSIFRTDGHPSIFAFAVRRYADIYMHEVGHLLNYSPNHHFYPQHALHMAHDPIHTSTP